MSDFFSQIKTEISFLTMLSQLILAAVMWSLFQEKEFHIPLHKTLE
jgi:hypothetical protein